MSDYNEHLISLAGGDGEPEQKPETVVSEKHDFGRLWSDGTFNKLGWNDEKLARREFDEKGYELKNVPEALRPVFARRKVVTTTEIYTAEAVA